MLHRDAVAGQIVILDAAGTRDPDGDAIDHRWWHYAEAGTYGSTVGIQNAESPQVRFVAPTVESPKTIHIILQATDRGEPRLTSYRRVIVRVSP